ncbi:hypothetical protein BDBG_00412 [Blastomyces gilchristii SLH14081]|uniref:Uncharacterized protein n=1 Tax=Blastomyces gilchristii (strain SLH14081) TaxID=559298 RepID=A0A179U6S3_BLAGS|nr:uncharacterized protein BDBG_00412 [Blastomyces gilchristii SLH14081]OAT03725.1 hypothetical protein BDBG_00412 [Blastomyces gilchristii SLH14081]
MCSFVDVLVALMRVDQASQPLRITSSGSVNRWRHCHCTSSYYSITAESEKLLVPITNPPHRKHNYRTCAGLPDGWYTTLSDSYEPWLMGWWKGLDNKDQISMTLSKMNNCDNRTFTSFTNYMHMYL